jgi:hypothetical protein
MLRLDLGLGLNRPWRALDRILSDLRGDPNVQIAGRDGSMSLANPGCTFLDPATGDAISANRAYNLVGPGGLTLPMYTAFPAIENLCPAVTSSVALASNTLSGLTRTIVEDATNGVHGAGSAQLALTDGVVYAFTAIIRREVGARHAAVYWARSGQRAGFVIDLGTGVATAATQGGGTVANLVSTTTALGYKVTGTITNAAWGGTVQTTEAFNENGATLDINYQGDGVSSVSFNATTLVASTLTPLGIAEGATRAADANIWTMPDALTQD